MTDEIKPSSGNIFQDLGFSDEIAESLRIRSELMSHLIHIISQKNLTQTQAGKLFGVSQPRISDLVRGKIDKFSSEKLIDMLTKAGAKVTFSVKEEQIAA